MEVDVEEGGQFYNNRPNKQKNGIQFSFSETIFKKH